MILRQSFRLPLGLLLLAALCLFATQVSASYGDRLPEFRRCVEVNCPSFHLKSCLLINLPGLRTRELRQWPCLNPHPYASSLILPAVLTSLSHPAPPAPLGLPSRMRLHLPTYNHGPARRRRRTDRAIPRQMAFLPLPRHARTLLRLLLTSQLPRPPERPLEDHLRHPSSLHAAQILRLPRILRHG